MQSHVICCNDSVEFVIVDDGSNPEAALKKANTKLEALQKAYFDRNRHAFGCCVLSDDPAVRAKTDADAWESYKLRCYWHIHSVGAEA